jgi:hypothetical protein
MSMFEPTLRQLMTVLLAASMLLISGCLTSDKPLIETSDFPLPAGSKIFPYSDETGAYEKAEPTVKTLTIRDGWYVDTEADGKEIRFKLHKVNTNAWIMMTDMNADPSVYAYSWLRHEGDLYVLYPSDAERFRNWKGRAGLNTGWKVEGRTVQILSLDYLKSLMPTAIVAEVYTKPFAYQITDGATPPTKSNIVTPEMMEVLRKNSKDNIKNIENKLRENEEQQKLVRARIKENEEQTKKLCGGRVCVIENNTLLYRTEKTDPPMWYYEDGRLAPESVWPK